MVSVDENVSIAPEPSSTKKKKKNSEKEKITEVTVSEPILDISTVEKICEEREVERKRRLINAEGRIRDCADTPQWV